MIKIKKFFEIKKREIYLENKLKTQDISNNKWLCKNENIINFQKINILITFMVSALKKLSKVTLHKKNASLLLNFYLFTHK